MHTIVTTELITSGGCLAEELARSWGESEIRAQLPGGSRGFALDNTQATNNELTNGQR